MEDIETRQLDRERISIAEAHAQQVEPTITALGFVRSETPVISTYERAVITWVKGDQAISLTYDTRATQITHWVPPSHVKNSHLDQYTGRNIPVKKWITRIPTGDGGISERPATEEELKPRCRWFRAYTRSPKAITWKRIASGKNLDRLLRRLPKPGNAPKPLIHKFTKDAVGGFILHNQGILYYGTGSIRSLSIITLATTQGTGLTLDISRPGTKVWHLIEVCLSAGSNFGRKHRLILTDGNRYINVTTDTGAITGFKHKTIKDNRINDWNGDLRTDSPYPFRPLTTEDQSVIKRAIKKYSQVVLSK